MGAIRRKFSTNFTMVHNEYLNDSRLSGSEMGWLTYMLSRPDNWNFSIEGLAHTHSDGKTRIMTTLSKESCISSKTERSLNLNPKPTRTLQKAKWKQLPKNMAYQKIR